MSRRILTYNNRDLSLFGSVHVSGEGVLKKPAPEFEHISVPGRSGDVLIYNGRYSNIDITYRFGITRNFDNYYKNLISMLIGEPGYHKLVDSKYPDVYRMAAIERIIEPQMSPQLSVGEFDVTFNCKPQLYLASGDEVATTWDSEIYTTNSIYNPEPVDVYPLIKIITTNNNLDQTENFNVTLVWYRSGSFAGSSTLQYKKATSLNAMYGPIMYDSESGDAYSGNAGSEHRNLNDRFSASNNVLIPAKCDFRAYVSGTSSRSQVSKIEIIPRWWRL